MRPLLPLAKPSDWKQPIRQTSVAPATRGGIPVSAWPFLLFVPAWTWLIGGHRILAVLLAVGGYLLFAFLTRLEPFWIAIIARVVVARLSRFAVAPRWLWKRCSYMAPR
jgi:hypothetical protein